MINEQLMRLLMAATGSSKKEVSSTLQDLSYECFTNMDKKQRMSSWTKTKYPETDVYLRIDARRDGLYGKRDFKPGEIKGNVNIRLPDKNTHFSSNQVEEFIVNNIILGD